MKKLVFLLLLLPVFLFSQDTTIVVPTPDAIPEGGNVVDWVMWLYNNLAEILGWFSALLITLSVFLRAVSTKINVDPLMKLIELFDRISNFGIFPKNRRMGGGQFVATSRVVGGEEKLEVGDVVETQFGKKLKVFEVKDSGTYLVG